MRTWVYSWKSSDGLRHENEMGAPSKDAVYDALRERGIRAIRVTERIEPIVRKGFAGLRKRDWSLIVAVGAAVAVALLVLAPSPVVEDDGGAEPRASSSASPAPANVARPASRRHLPPIEGFDAARVFGHVSDAYLVRYVRPGVVLEEDAANADVIEDLIANVKTPILIDDGDSPEVVELKRIVAGIKGEVALLLSGGRGINDILTWLDERQKMEAEHRAKIIGNYRRGVTGKDATNRLLSTLGLEEVE